MQSDRGSCCGDVVLDSVNMVFRDEDSLLDQIYEKQICLNSYYEYLIFFMLLTIMHILNYNSTLLQGLKNPNIFASHIFGIKQCLSPWI